MTTNEIRRFAWWFLAALLLAMLLGFAATAGGVLAAPRSQVKGTDQAMQSDQPKQPGTTEEDQLAGCGQGSLYFEIEPNGTITTAQALPNVEMAQIEGGITPVGD